MKRVSSHPTVSKNSTSSTSTSKASSFEKKRAEDLSSLRTSWNATPTCSLMELDPQVRKTIVVQAAQQRLERAGQVSDKNAAPTAAGKKEERHEQPQTRQHSRSLKHLFKRTTPRGGGGGGGVGRSSTAAPHHHTNQHTGNHHRSIRESYSHTRTRNGERSTNNGNNEDHDSHPDSLDADSYPSDEEGRRYRHGYNSHDQDLKSWLDGRLGGGGAAPSTSTKTKMARLQFRRQMHSDSKKINNNQKKVNRGTMQISPAMEHQAAMDYRSVPVEELGIATKLLEQQQWQQQDQEPKALYGDDDKEDTCSIDTDPIPLVKVHRQKTTSTSNHAKRTESECPSDEHESCSLTELKGDNTGNESIYPTSFMSQSEPELIGSVWGIHRDESKNSYDDSDDDCCIDSTTGPLRDLSQPLQSDLFISSWTTRSVSPTDTIEFDCSEDDGRSDDVVDHSEEEEIGMEEAATTAAMSFVCQDTYDEAESGGIFGCTGLPFPKESHHATHEEEHRHREVDDFGIEKKHPKGQQWPVVDLVTLTASDLNVTPKRRGGTRVHAAAISLSSFFWKGEEEEEQEDELVHHNLCLRNRRPQQQAPGDSESYAEPVENVDAAANDSALTHVVSTMVQDKCYMVNEHSTIPTTKADEAGTLPVEPFFAVRTNGNQRHQPTLCHGDDGTIQDHSFSDSSAPPPPPPESKLSLFHMAAKQISPCRTTNEWSSSLDYFFSSVTEAAADVATNMTVDTTTPSTRRKRPTKRTGPRPKTTKALMSGEDHLDRPQLDRPQLDRPQPTVYKAKAAAKVSKFAAAIIGVYDRVSTSRAAAMMTMATRPPTLLYHGREGKSKEEEECNSE